MKLIFTLCMVAVTTFSASAQTLLTDDFNYSGALTANGWTQTGTEAGDPISTTTGLTYAGHPGSGIGNAANLTGTLQDVNKGFTKQTTNGGQVWLSVLVNVTEATNISGNGVNFLHLGDRSDSDPTSFTNFAGRLFVKANASGVSFGASQTSSSAYGTGVFQRNTTYLLVMKYTINTAGNDDLSLWVLSAGVPPTEFGLGTPELSNSGLGQDEIDAVGLRQANSLPDITVDGLRIATSYDQLALPLTLVNFSGSLTENYVNLQWTSANENNVSNFSIERSIDAKLFSEIGSVAAKNINRAEYSFADNTPVPGVSYYRLKMIDKDGRFTLSSIVVINNKITTSVKSFPNPATISINVNHPSASGTAVIRLYSLEGKLVKTVQLNKQTLQTTISLIGLLPGHYMIEYSDGNVRSSSQFVKL